MDEEMLKIVQNMSAIRDLQSQRRIAHQEKLRVHQECQEQSRPKNSIHLPEMTTEQSTTDAVPLITTGTSISDISSTDEQSGH